MADLDARAPGQVPALIADHVVTTAAATGRSLKTISRQTLAAAIADVTIETQTAGATTLALPLIDNNWKILRSGLCDVDSEGLLPMVDVNYPEGTDVWWRLAMVDWTDDLTAANVTLTFILRCVSYLQDDFGPLSVSPGTTTRAQFVKQLADRIPGALARRKDPAGNYVLGPGSAASQKVLTVIPELNVVQQIATTASVEVTSVDYTTTAANTTAKDPTKAASLQRLVNKQAGIATGAGLTVKGQAMSDAQREVAAQIMDQCFKRSASTVVNVAIIYAAIGENGLSANNTFQCEEQPGTTSEEAGWWLSGGSLDFPTGGAIGIARAKPNYTFWQIANDTEANAVWNRAVKNGTTGNRSLADSYYLEDGGSAFEAEAVAIVNAYGGGRLGAGGQGAAVVSDVSQLTRGSSDNPDEDSWTCMQRLASEVNWMVFTDPHPAPGVWGNYVYYIDGPTCDQQTPSLTLSLSDDAMTWTATAESKQTRVVAQDGVTGIQGTVDNSAFQYQTVKTRKGKVQRTTTVKGPETPTSIVFTMLTDVMEICAGSVILIKNAGPMNGRWIVTDTTQNMLSDLYCTFTLGPPTAPEPEPAADTSTTSVGAPTSTSTSSGNLADAVTIAKAAATLESQRHCYTYTEGAGRTNDGNSPTSAPYSFDCSGFCGACYKFAGLPAPYGSAGYTGTSGDVVTGGTMKQTTIDKLAPGDLVVFPADGSKHVTLYAGNGECVNMGRMGEPVVESLAGQISFFGGSYSCWHLPEAT